MYVCMYVIDELRQRLLHVWRGLNQSLIDDAVNQWQTRLRACVVPVADILNILCDVNLFSLYLMNFMF